MEYVKQGSIRVAECLHKFIESEALPGADVDTANFWQEFERLIADLTPVNRALLAKRDDLQQKIDSWHRENSTFDLASYKSFLGDIGYLLPEPEDFEIAPFNVDTPSPNQPHTISSRLACAAPNGSFHPPNHPARINSEASRQLMNSDIGSRTTSEMNEAR